MMGLSIHYRLAASGGDADARRLVARLRERALGLPFEDISDVLAWRGDEPDAPPVVGDWLLQRPGTPTEEEHWVFVRPIQVYVFTATCAGAEVATFGLASHPSAVL